MTFPTVWTPELRDRLAGLLRQGLSARKIAAQLGNGITRNAVIGKVGRDKELRAIGFQNSPGYTYTETELRERRNSTVRRYRAKRHTPSSFQLLTFTDKNKASEERAKPVKSVKLAADIAFEPRNIPLIDLKARDCRWPSEGEGADTLFCGHRSLDGLPYRKHHSRRAYLELRCVEAA